MKKWTPKQTDGDRVEQPEARVVTLASAETQGKLSFGGVTVIAVATASLDSAGVLDIDLDLKAEETT